MRIIEPKAYLMMKPKYEEVIEILESAGRTCYKSEENICEGSAEKFIKNILKRGHESVIEHISLTAKFICDRGVSHEIVRHRIASYSQESTRYCNYTKDKFNSEITVIRPCFFIPGSIEWEIWENSCLVAERSYFNLLEGGCTPQQARLVLPNSLKTEVVMTANIREWRHFFKLRCAKAAHPQMREVANILLKEMIENYGVLFEDIDIDIG